METRFSKGQTVRATVTAQGMVKDALYVVTNVKVDSTPFGGFTRYTLRGEGGRELDIGNGHLLLSGPVMTADVCENCGVPLTPVPQAGRGEPRMCNACSPTPPWTLELEDHGFSYNPTVSIQIDDRLWVIAFEDCDRVVLTWVDESDDQGDEEGALVNSWTISAVRARVSQLTEPKRLPPVPNALLADLFIGKGW